MINKFITILFNIKKNIIKFFPYIRIILIISFIFILSIPFYFTTSISNDDLKNIINTFVGLIGGIVGITFSLFLMYIQNLSNNFSGGVYHIISRRKESFITFILFSLLIFILLFLSFNFLDIENQLLLYYSIISLFLALYFLWDFYSWAINNLPPLKIANYFKEDSKKQLISLNKKLSKKTNKNNKEIILFYFASNSEKSLYYLYNSLLGGIIKMLNNNLLFDAKQIVEIFFLMLNDFLKIFNDKFNIHPDFNIVLATNSTFTNFFATLLIKINRNCENIILPAKDYELLNSILYGYRDLIINSLHIKYVGNDRLKDENPILSIILGQFNDLGEKIIKHKEIEGAFTWLKISQEIGPDLINSDCYINIINFLSGLQKFIVQIDLKFDDILLQENIKSYSNLLNQIYIKGDNLNYLYNYFGEILDGIKLLLLLKTIRNKDGVNLQSDLNYQNIFNGIRNLNLKYINGELDRGNLYFNNEIRKLLDGFIDGIEFYKQNNIGIKDYIHIRWFCELLLNMLEDELEKGDNNNFYMYYQFFEKLSKLVIEYESGDELNTIFNYQIKIFSLIIRHNLDDYKLYYKYFEELINLYKNTNDKRYSFINKIYEELALILVLLKKEGKEYFGLDELIKNYEKAENEKMKEGYDGDINDIKNYLFPITKYLLNYVNNFNEYENNHIIYSSFNSFFDEWFIKKFDLTKNDFKNYLGIEN